MGRTKAASETAKILLGSLLGHRSPLVPVPLPADKLSRHTAILAQSGAGKSFFLGRLIEELLLKTSCRVLVLDPNSDFVRVDQVDAAAWNDPVLQPWFADDDTFERFDDGWKAVRTAILTHRNLDAGTRPLQLLWSSLTPAEKGTLLAIDPGRQPGEHWCLATAEAKAARDNPPGYTFFDLEAAASRLAAAKAKNDPLDEEWTKLPTFTDFQAASRADDATRVATRIQQLRDWKIWAEAEGRTTTLEALLRDDLRQGVLPLFGDAGAEGFRLAVVDLQSLPSAREQQLVTSIVLAELWSRARREQAERLEDPESSEEQRVPTFVVLDEAHNLVPASAEPDSVHQQLVRFAGEGRKYDLFLVVVTQSARKIDPLVLSQCENLCVLRTGNDADLHYLQETLGYPPLDLARLAFSFGVGDALLAGPLSPHPVLLHAFPRRTQQGGKGLSKQWTVRNVR